MEVKKQEKSLFLLVLISGFILIFIFLHGSDGNYTYGFTSGRRFMHRVSFHTSKNTEVNSWKSVRVLCFVETHPKNLEKQTKYIKMTWGPKCDVTLYVSDEFNETFPTIAVTNYTGYKQLWAKTRSTVQLIYDQYMYKADWFLKADDDTYVHVENLKRFLANKDSNTDLNYYGKFFKPFVKGGYNSGGGGYVFGRAALKRLVEKAFKNDTACMPISVPKAEDIWMGHCMSYAGVTCSKDVLDKNGRELFHSFTPEREYQIPWWIIPFYRDFSIHKLGADQCCSPDAISYHYVKGASMLFVDYLFHNFTKD